MKKLMCIACIAVSLSAISCGSSGSHNNCVNYRINNANTTTNVQGNNDYDENIKKSVERERELRDAGMDNAANIERKARYEYEHGGGYTSPNGGRQIHFQGSKEQQEQLKMMDELGW